MYWKFVCQIVKRSTTNTCENGTTKRHSGRFLNNRYSFGMCLDLVFVTIISIFSALSVELDCLLQPQLAAHEVVVLRLVPDPIIHATWTVLFKEHGVFLGFDHDVENVINRIGNQRAVRTNLR